METEIKNKQHGKVTLIVLGSIILVFIIYYSVMSMIESWSGKLEEIKKEIAAKSSKKNDI